MGVDEETKASLVPYLALARNQYKIFLVGCFEELEVNIDGVKYISYFEVIKIMDEKDPTQW